MQKTKLPLLFVATFIVAVAPVAAMPEGSMMKHEMSAKNMKKLAACKAMDHAMAMKNKNCMKLMKAAAMHDEMAPAAPMADHKM
jgi:hypothetical protein